MFGFSKNILSSTDGEFNNFTGKGVIKAYVLHCCSNSLKYSSTLVLVNLEFSLTGFEKFIYCIVVVVRSLGRYCLIPVVNPGFSLWSLKN